MANSKRRLLLVLYLVIQLGFSDCKTSLVQDHPSPRLFEYVKQNAKRALSTFTRRIGLELEFAHDESFNVVTKKVIGELKSQGYNITDAEGLRFRVTQKTIIEKEYFVRLPGYPIIKITENPQEGSFYLQSGKLHLHFSDWAAVFKSNLRTALIPQIILNDLSNFK